MRESTALEVAVGLLQLPSRARMLRDGELPSDVEFLLRIVAGDDQALSDAMRTTALPESEVRASVSFYVEQILLHSDADSYRALGAGPEATIDQLRRNMALLLRWLHPDREANSARAIYVGRVTQAWNNLKTVDRRALYDETRKRVANGKSAGKSPHEGVGRQPPMRTAAASGYPPRASSPLVRSAGNRQRPVVRRPSIWRLLGRLFGHNRI